VELVVVPGAGHFFENSLDQLKNVITQWVTSRNS
jgi:alpha/beta superfamily hydrolase